MEAATAPSIPRWFWIVSILGLLWMLFGVFAFVMDLMTDEASLEGMSEAQRRLYLARPGWLLVDYAVAIFSGLAGTIALVLRRTWAVPLLGLSLVAAILQFGYVLFGMNALAELGPAATLPFPIVIVAIGAGLLWLAVQARARGWLA